MSVARKKLPGEKHAPIKVGPLKFVRATFEGPGTNLSTRIRRGDKPVSFIDKSAKAHDLRYSLSKDAGSVRKADNKFIAVAKRGRKQKKDFPINLAVGKTGIQAKKLLENLGVSPTKFTTFGSAIGTPDEPIFRRELKKLESQGFGKRKTKGGGSNPWISHVKSVRKKNPGLSYKDSLKKASKTYGR